MKIIWLFLSHIFAFDISTEIKPNETPENRFEWIFWKILLLDYGHQGPEKYEFSIFGAYKKSKILDFKTSQLFKETRGPLRASLWKTFQCGRKNCLERASRAFFRGKIF